MADEITGNAGPSKPVQSENLTADDFVSLFDQDATEQLEQSEQEDTDTEEVESDEVEETEEEETEEEEESESEDEAANIDFDTLSPEQIRDLAKKGKSRLLGDLAKARQEALAFKQQLEEAQKQQENPLKPKTTEIHDTIAAVSDLDGLREKLGHAEALEEWAQLILDEHGAAGADEVIANHGDKEFTKSEVIARRNFARRLQKKDIPARLAQIQAAETVGRQAEEAQAAARHVFPEIDDEESVVGATYKATMDDPVLKEAFEKVPALKAKVPFILALAASKHAEMQAKPGTVKPSKATATGVTPRPKVPAVPSNAGAASGKPNDRQKRADQLKRQAEQSGSPDDFAAWLDSQ